MTLHRALALLAPLALLTAPEAAATTCGTVGTPLACSIDVGGTVRYTVSDIDFGINSASGGGNLYVADDIAIDIASGGGLSLLLSFAKSAANPGTVFFANAGADSSFSFTYTLTATALTPGSIDFDSITTTIAPFSTFMNGFAGVQGIVAGQVNCNVSVPNNSDDTCAISGAGPLDVGDIVSLSGQGGNVSIGGFSNRFDVSFTPDDTTPVPAPAGFALLLTAALGCASLRARRG